LFIGIIHGFAGFSHLFALLPSLALPTVWDSLIYLIAFAAGTIVTMILFAFILGIVAFQSVIKNKQVFLKWFTLCGGFLAIAVGILWLIHPV
jgi:cytochrome c biogenesis protein CcdA